MDRLWSAYTFQRKLGNITGLRTFEEYLRTARRRKRDGSDLVPRDHFHGLYIGYYADYVGLWLDAFGDDLKIVFVEDCSATPTASSGACSDGWRSTPKRRLRIWRRATRRSTREARARPGGVALKRSDRTNGNDPVPPARTAPYRLRTGQRRPAPRLDPATRRHVEDLYRESNTETARILVAHGYRNLPDWLHELGSRPDRDRG